MIQNTEVEFSGTMITSCLFQPVVKVARSVIQRGLDHVIQTCVIVATIMMPTIRDVTVCTATREAKREGEEERERQTDGVCVCVYVCVCAYVWFQCFQQTRV